MMSKGASTNNLAPCELVITSNGPQMELINLNPLGRLRRFRIAMFGSMAAKQGYRSAK